MSRDERRAHVRIDVLLEPVEMAVIDRELSDGPDARSTLVVNISAGGLGLVCRRPLPTGCLLRLVLELPQGIGRLKAEGEVVRCTAVGLSGLRKWRVGLAFRNLSRREQDRISAFVLHQQQLLRRRGLL